MIAPLRNGFVVVCRSYLRSQPEFSGSQSLSEVRTNIGNEVTSRRIDFYECDKCVRIPRRLTTKCASISCEKLCKNFTEKTVPEENFVDIMNNICDQNLIAIERMGIQMAERESCQGALFYDVDRKVYECICRSGYYGENCENIEPRRN